MYSSGSIKERERTTDSLKKYPEGDKVVSYQKRGHLEMQTDTNNHSILKELIKTDSTSGGETIKVEQQSKTFEQ